MVRLAGGVVTGRGLRAWALGPAGSAVGAIDPAVDAIGSAVDATDSDLPAGSPVAIGPRDAAKQHVENAVHALAALVKAGGPVAAGAGVDLGDGFSSARLAGARGDRRDAVLAALRVLGLDGAGRLGDRATVQVALFGPAVTKPVGVAASTAIAEGRWAAVHIASAASDMLGPEQLERVLRLEAPTGIDPCPYGMASLLANDLRVVLGPVNRPRRLALVVDLWESVSAHVVKAVRKERLLATQARQSRVVELRRRREHYEDEILLAQVRFDVGHEPTVAEAARWLPGPREWSDLLHRLTQDAVAATVLLRTAVAVVDHGLEEGLRLFRGQLDAAAVMHGQLDPRVTRRVPGLTGLPARPGRYVLDLHHLLEREDRPDARAAEFIHQRLARAHDYGIVIFQAIDEVATGLVHAAVPWRMLSDWLYRDLRAWRAVAGYTAARPASEWTQPRPALDADYRDAASQASLAERLSAAAHDNPSDLETLGDWLWYADLADAHAQLHGHDAAEVEHGPDFPRFDANPATPEPDPLTPRLDSIPVAVAGAAQLMSLGAVPARSIRTWTGLVDDLMASAAVAEALTGGFTVPPPLAGHDGSLVPGTEARIEFARDARQLAEWSRYMGNCIAGDYYRDDAAAGRCGLVAIRDQDGRILVNVELRPARRGWRIDEFRARFNADPDPELERSIRAWVTTLRAPSPRSAAAPPRVTHARGGRRGIRTGGRLLREIGQSLGERAEQALADPETLRALSVFESVSHRLNGEASGAAGDTGDPHAGVGTLRRAAPARLVDACRRTLRDRLDGRDPAAPWLDELWVATGVRPLAAALAGLDAALRDRYERLELILNDGPLPGSLRRLARRRAIASARSVDLVGLRLRQAIGALTRDADPVMDDGVSRHLSTAVLCALALAVTSWTEPHGDGDPRRTYRVTAPGEVEVPGFPGSRLTDHDGPWPLAWPHARELGASEIHFDQIIQSGLLVPASWLGTGGWPGLWSHAARPAARH